MDDGTLVNDGSGWLVDERGRAIKNKDGKQIGAKNIEAGLLNILFGGTSGKGYNEFSVMEKIISFSILEDSGIEKSYPDGKYGMSNAQWDKNDRRALNMDYIMDYAGNTVATKDDLTFSLAYSENPWGLFYDIDLNNKDYQQLSHMNSSSIMNYLSLFGSEGVKLYDNKLYGVQKNMVLGKTGSTGLSTGIHLDFAQYNKAGKKIDPFEFHWNTLLNERIFLDDDFGFSLETDKFHFDVWNTMHNKAPQKVFKEYNKELLEITPNYGGFGT